MTQDNREKLNKEILADLYFEHAVRFVINKLGDVHGKVIFDSGCGVGKMSVFFALQGATVIGIDKDRSRLSAASSLANSLGVQSSCLFLHGSSEECPIESDSIDIIFSKSTIQYMERDKALNEYVRILKQGGSMALLENLPYNPFIILYRIHRKLTAIKQKKTEYADSIKGYIKTNDIDRLSPCFRFVEQREYHLLRMNFMYLLKKLHFSASAHQLDNLISKIDTSLLTSIPFLRKLAWLVAVYYEDKQCNAMDVLHEERTRSIGQYIAKAKVTWSPLYLIKAIYLLILQRRLIEVMYGLYDYICFSPSVVTLRMISMDAL